MTPAKAAKSVDDYVAALKPDQQELVNTLRGIIQKAAPKIQESIKWGMPVFELDGLVCAIIAAKKHVSFGFYKGTKLSDPDGLLEGAGTKLRHVKIHCAEDIRKTVFTRWVKQAVRLNAAKT